MDIKASNTVELAEYAVAKNIEDEPDFKWWVKDVIRKSDQIISKVKEKYWRATHNFGIQVPKTVEEAYKIDQQMGTTFGKNQSKRKWLTCVSLSRY